MGQGDGLERPKAAPPGAHGPAWTKPPEVIMVPGQRPLRPPSVVPEAPQTGSAGT